MLSLARFRFSSVSASFSLRTLSTLPPHTVLGLPALSPTMESGNIASWNKTIGDAINAGDIIAEIETDKATVDFEAQDDVFLAKILMPEGSQDVAVGTPIAIVVEEEEDVVAFENYESDTAAPAAPPAPAPAAPEQESQPAPVADAAPAAPASDKSYPPHTVVGLPALSPTMEQGTVSEWMLKEGDEISAGTLIATIDTDKASVDFEAQDDGYLAKIIAPAGSELDVGTPIMVTVEDEDDIAAFADFTVEAAAAPAAAAAAPAATRESAEPATTPEPEPQAATPVAPEAVSAPAPTTPEPVASTPAATPSSPPSSSVALGSVSWAASLNSSPISAALAASQQAYVDRYGSSLVEIPRD